MVCSPCAHGSAIGRKIVKLLLRKLRTARVMYLVRPTSAVAWLVGAALSLLPTGTFTLDPAKSRVEFSVKDNRGGFSGVAPDVEAQAVVREQADTFVADVTVRIDARTMTTGIGLRDGQMRRDFLETDRFPFITFQGSASLLDQPSALPFRALLKGQLMIKGMTREIEVPLRVIALRDVYLVEGQVTIRLSEFQIPIPRFLFFVAEDPVVVTLKLRLAAR